MSDVTYESFRDEWLMDVQAGKPTTTELGRRFAGKLMRYWLDIDDASDDVVFCDGAGDGGIDVACLQRGEPTDAEGNGPSGDVWYLVQSKYGSAFAGPGTLLEEGQKVIDTLDGKRPNLSSLAQGLLERLTQFRRQASDADRIVLVFGTVEPLNDVERRALTDVGSMGRGRLGAGFDVASICVDTLYRRAQDAAASAQPALKVPLKATLADSGTDLRVGAISLLNLFDFLKAYKAKTGELDELYEKNVRRFLPRSKVNKAMQATLRATPERFGLYNNGITIVVTDFSVTDDYIELTEPYVVNGCQTTRTIWEVFYQRLESGGTGADPKLVEWKKKAGEGVVVAKIVKVGAADSLLEAITRYTNSQNAVREKDFIALTSDFRSWARQMAERYKVFLEVQRGGWDSQRAKQKQDPNGPQFDAWANAFDLLKVYAAGWMGEAGAAFGRNASFAPNGTIFKAVINAPPEDAFDVEDLYAAYRLDIAADKYGFGRGAQKDSRRQTRFLFFMTVIELMRGVLLHESRPTTRKAITRSLLQIFEPDVGDAAAGLLDSAIDLIDEYMNPEMSESVFKEPIFKGDLNTLLKYEALGKSDKDTPQYRTLLGVYRRSMGQKHGGQPSPRDQIVKALKPTV
jgi:hypothetical protein